ncbi:MAG: BrnA antitoxin family protein [Acidobacteriota bacterium]
MEEAYDFSEGVRNPYAKRLKKQITIRLDRATVDYFQDLSNELGIPYQTLINLYLAECVREKKRPALEWRSEGEARGAA